LAAKNPAAHGIPTALCTKKDLQLQFTAPCVGLPNGDVGPDFQILPGSAEYLAIPRRNQVGL
jgi:hypothetical protein